MCVSFLNANAFKSLFQLLAIDPKKEDLAGEESVDGSASRCVWRGDQKRKPERRGKPQKLGVFDAIFQLFVFCHANGIIF